MALLLPVGEVYKLFSFCGALYYGGQAVDIIGCVSSHKIELASHTV